MTRAHRRAGPPSPPSPWIVRFAPLIRAEGRVLDLACGAGRHARHLRERGHRVTAIDIDVSALADVAGDAGIEIVQADLEKGGPGPLKGRRFAAAVVTNYLFRLLLAPLVDCLEPGGVLLYETFAVGNERFGRPRNPDYLLERGELLALAAGQLEVIAYEHVALARPAPAMVQRLCARKRPRRQPRARRAPADSRAGGRNARSCASAGMAARARATRASARSATTTPVPVPPSARTSPQGSTIREWP